MKNLRKTIASVLSSVLIFSVCSASISFASGECTHPYTHTHEAVEATCDSSGFIPGTYCLTCYETVVKGTYTPAKGHKFSYSHTVKPTCTQNGYDVMICSVCKEERKENYASALNHKTGSVIRGDFNGSCTIGAYTKYDCLICTDDDYAYTGESAPGHSFVGGVCTVCNVSSDWQYYFSVYEQGIIISGYAADAIEVTVPDTIEGFPVISIDNDVFSGKSMTKLILPSTLTSLGAVRNCKNLKSLTIPEKVTELVASAFEGCTALKSINLPESMKSIGSEAFAGCTSLEEIELPFVGDSIGEDVFAGCTGLKKATMPLLPEKTGNGLFSGCTSLENVTMSDFQKKIPDGMFKGCSSLKTIELPAFLKEIGQEAFINTGLEQTELPRYLEKIGFSAFSGSSLKEVTIPGTVREIGLQAFMSCRALKKAVISEGVEVVGQNAFRFCESLSEVSLPSTLKTIGMYAFYCTALGKLTIPDSVEYIDIYAFSDCNSLTRVDFGKGSAELDHFSFYSCRYLADVRLSPTMTKIAETAFLETAYATPSEEDTTGNNSSGTNPLPEAPDNKVPDKEILDAIPDTVGLEVSVASLTASVPAGSVVVDKNGKALAAGELVGTGMRLIVKDGDRIIGEKIIVVPFDVDGDAKLSSADARLALRESVGLEALADCQKAAADVDDKSAERKITSADARAILRAAVGLDDADKWIKENIGK